MEGWYGVSGRLKAIIDAVANVFSKVENDPTRDAPIATGYPTPSTSASGIGTFTTAGVLRSEFGIEEATSASGTLVDVVNISGSGVLNFVIGGNHGSGNYQIVITVDGVDIVNFSTTSGSTSDMKAFVGGVVENASTLSSIAFDQIPFHSSLRIQHRRISSNGTVYTLYKLRRTS